MCVCVCVCVTILFWVTEFNSVAFGNERYLIRNIFHYFILHKK